jgi:hypothetical protein
MAEIYRMIVFEVFSAGAVKKGLKYTAYLCITCRIFSEASSAGSVKHIEPEESIWPIFLSCIGHYFTAPALNIRHM